MKSFLISIPIAVLVAGVLFYVLAVVFSPLTEGELSGQAEPAASRESGDTPSKASVPVDRETERPDALEACFRYMFEYIGSDQARAETAYFLSIDGSDPSPAFLHRFSGHDPAVRPGSAFEQGEGPLFTIESWRWYEDDRIEIRGGYRQGLLNATVSDYVLEKTADGWTVILNRTISPAGTGAQTARLELRP